MKKLIFSFVLAFFLLAAHSAIFAAPRTPLLLPTNPASTPSSVDNAIPATLPRSEILLDEHILSAFFDSTTSMSIDEVADKAKEDLFEPFSLQPFEKISGALWCRFVLGPAEESSLPPNQLFLDLGTSIPEKATLYVRSQALREPTPNNKEDKASKGKGTLDVQSSDLASPNLPLEWMEILPVKRGLFVLPKAGKTPITCYLRLDGVPGIWFSPVIRTVENTLRDWGSFYRLGAVIVMGVLFVLCLFRCLVEQGTWRLWGLLYIFCAGAQFWIGVPSVQETLGWRSLIAIILPALALILYPHLGRKLLRCPKEAPILNAQFILLSFVGLAVIVLPFLQSMKWIYRFIDLWPLGLIIFAPTALFACFRRRPGSLRFLIGSLIPPAAIFAIGYTGAQTPFSANFISAVPAWATAFSAIFIIGLPLGNTPQPSLALNLDLPIGKESGGLSLGKAEKKRGLAPSAVEKAPRKASSQVENLENTALQATLANSVATLCEQSKVLCSTQLPEPAKSTALHIARSAEEISLALEGKGHNNPQVPLAISIFNISNFLSSLRESVQEKLKQKNASVAWSVQPNLGEYYEGPAMEFAYVVTTLCEGMTISESKIQLTFKVEASKETAFRFLLSITGGAAMPSPIAIMAAKRLAQECRGGLKLESRPTETSIFFNVGFFQKVEVQENPNTGNVQAVEKKVSLLLLVEDPRISVRILALSKELPCTIRLAANPDEVVALHTKHPAHMFVFQGRSTSPSSERLITLLNKISVANGLPAPLFLAYTEDKSTWNTLASVGFTHALTLPVEKASFIDTFSEALQELFSAQEQTEAVRRPEPPVQIARGTEAPVQEPPLQMGGAAESPLQMGGEVPDQTLQMEGISEPTRHPAKPSEPPLQI